MMPTHTLTRLYDSHDDALTAVRSLEAAGFGHDHIGLVGPDGQTGPDAAETDPMTTGAAAGAAVGSAVGGSLGLLAGLGAIVIPGVGPVVAAGWIVTMLTGAGVGAAVGGSAGGLVGALIDAGVPEAEARSHAEAVRAGASLVAARVDATNAEAAQRIFAGEESRPGA